MMYFVCYVMASFVLLLFVMRKEKNGDDNVENDL